MPIEFLTERVGYIPGGVNIGVIAGPDRTAALVDSGLNESAAKKALKAVRDQLDSQVVAVLTTHAHADHFGGNATIVKRTGAKIYAPALDEAWLRYPILLPAMMFGGADPPESLRGGFLLAEPSPVDSVFQGDDIELLRLQIRVISLPGHSPGQVGLVVDDVFFAADVVLPVDSLEKHSIPYLYSVTDHLASLNRSRDVSCQWVVPGHGQALRSIESLVADNLEVVQRIISLVEAATSKPQSTDTVLATVLDDLKLTVDNDVSYYLARPTILGCLNHLLTQGHVRGEIRKNVQTWVAANAID